MHRRVVQTYAAHLDTRRSCEEVALRVHPVRECFLVGVRKPVGSKCRATSKPSDAISASRARDRAEVTLYVSAEVSTKNVAGTSKSGRVRATTGADRRSKSTSKRSKMPPQRQSRKRM